MAINALTKYGSLSGENLPDKINEIVTQVNTNSTAITTAQTDIATAQATADKVVHYNLTASPAEVAANTTAEQTFTVTGLATTSAVIVNKPTAQAGLGIVGVRVTATNTIGITFANVTASPITPTASQVYKVIEFKV